MTESKTLTELESELRAAQEELYALPPFNDDVVSARKDIISARIGRLKTQIAKAAPPLTELERKLLEALKAIIACDPFDCDAPSGTSKQMDAALRMGNEAIALAESRQAGEK